MCKFMRKRSYLHLRFSLVIWRVASLEMSGQHAAKQRLMYLSFHSCMLCNIHNTSENVVPIQRKKNNASTSVFFCFDI